MHLWLIPLLPLAGAAINGLLGRRFSKSTVTAVGLLFPGAAMLWTWKVAFQFTASQAPYIENHGTWLRAGDFVVNYSLYLDQLSLLMILIVTGVGFLIHVYSVGYMAHEGGYYRYFSYLNLFMFFMLTLVLASNYLLMFVGWEGVGLASYLLIGFFFLRDSASSAGKKAFIVNRIGDFGFLIALFLMIKHFGTLNFDDVFAKAAGADVGLLTAIGLLLLVGAAGKSAQLPLYVWLPDAMEGPTPVSALIHAATMVTAGVYMITRSHVIFDHAPDAAAAVAVIGALTALFAATIGLVQHDIKRVLAYSTVSQLGYMVMACGVAAYSAGMFHLMTHAFFKALLFLAAGSVIHGLGGEQDMRKMGGLRHDMPWTFWTMTMATFAITGVPMFSGFFSKDEILWRTFASGHTVLWFIGWFTAFLTAFYMFRLWFLTFFGEFRGQPAHGAHETPGREHHQHEGHAHESPKVMLVPLVILAVLSVIGGWIGVPPALAGSNHFEHFLDPVLLSSASAEATGVAQPATEDFAPERTLAVSAIGAGVAGFLLAWLMYSRRRDLPAKLREQFQGAYTMLENKYYVDEFYGAAVVKPLIEGSRAVLWKFIDQGLIDGTVNESAAAARDVSNSFRRMQSGNIRSYAGWIAAGAAVVIAYMLYMGVR